jgi:tetratricopeptide (TPR) repeat protein
MPPAVGERVEASDHALIGPGEIRPVVVAAFPLAVDYRDDAEDNAVLLDLNAGVDAIMTAVQAHGGLLLRLDVLGGGSAALAAFGVSQTLRRATRDAVSCALWLSQRMAKRRTNWGVRAGIEAGRAYMGELGSPLKREVALVGGPAVVALDLARHAGTAQVLVGETAWRLAGTAVRPLLRLMGYPVEEEVDTSAALDSVVKVLARRTRRQPLLLGVEDLDHADAGTLALLARIVSAAPSMTAMVAVTLCSGDERSERALKSARPTWVAVPPLNRLEARAVFFGFLGARPDLQADDERELDLLLQRAGGNPSLLRELAELCRCRLAEGKTLVQACRLLREVASPGELSQLRLDGLTATDRDLTRLCSVLGSEFESVLLWRVLKAGEPSTSVGEMLARVSQLKQVGVLSATMVGHVSGCRFRERSLREVAYASWPVATRARWHTRVAEALSTATPGEMAAGPTRLAAHLKAGEHPVEAAPHLLASARALAEGGELDAASESLSSALTLLAEDTAAARGVELELATLDLRCGSFADAQRWAGGVADDPAAPSDLRARACLVRARAAVEGDDIPAAVTAAEAGRRLLARRGDPALHARLCAVEALARGSRGELERAKRLVEEGVAELLARDPSAAESPARMELDRAQATVLLGMGRRAAAETLLEEQATRAEEGSLFGEAAHARALLGSRLVCVSPTRAVMALRAALTVWESRTEPARAAACRWDLMRALLRAADVQEARALVEQAEEMPGLTSLQAVTQAVRAQVLAPQDRVAARQAAERAVAVVDHLSPGARAPALLELARACRALGDGEGTSRWLETAREQATDLRRADLLEDVEADARSSGEFTAARDG